MEFQMQGSNLIMYGFDPISGTLRPVGTTDSGQILFAGFANSGEGQDANIGADYVVGNASGQIAFTTNLSNTTIYTAPIKTNHATSILFTAYFTSSVAGNYSLDAQFVSEITGPITDYHDYSFNVAGSFAVAAPAWAGEYYVIGKDSITVTASIHQAHMVVAPYVRFGIVIPNNPGTTTGSIHYSLCR